MNNEQENVKDDSIQEKVDFTQPDFTFIPKEVHEWRQKGPFIVCKSCEIMHAVYIGTEKIMVGMDEQGKPLFKRKLNY